MTLKHKKIEKTMLCPGPLNYDDYHRFIGEKYNTSDIILGLVDKESKNLYSNHQWNINKIKEKKIYLDCLDGFSMSHKIFHILIDVVWLSRLKYFDRSFHRW